jgi:hypothetical protein
VISCRAPMLLQRSWLGLAAPIDSNFRAGSSIGRRRPVLTLLPIVLAFAWQLQCSAAVYRCQLGGRTVIQDVPCPAVAAQEPAVGKGDAEMRRRADALRAEEAKKRDEIQKNFSHGVPSSPIELRTAPFSYVMKGYNQGYIGTVDAACIWRGRDDREACASHEANLGHVRFVNGNRFAQVQCLATRPSCIVQKTCSGAGLPVEYANVGIDILPRAENDHATRAFERAVRDCGGIVFEHTNVHHREEQRMWDDRLKRRK